MFNTDNSVYVTVDVPNFGKLPISFSGAIVSTMSGPPIMPREALASIVSVLPRTPAGIGAAISGPPSTS